MKKVYYYLFVILAIICLLIVANGCTSSPKIENTKTYENSLFTIIEYNENLHFFVVYMNDTKVMYSISDGLYNRGNFTLLVNKDGSPMVYKGQ